MKRKFLILPLILLNTAFSLNSLAKTEEWVIDEQHSKIGFEIAHLVISSVEGKFDSFSGSVFFDPKNTKAKDFKINATIMTKSIDTGAKKRDNHLRRSDFFDAKKFPKIIFTSTQIIRTGKKKFKIVGFLTIKDKKKKVTLKTQYFGSASAYGKERIAFKATTSFNREDFGLTWNDLVEAGPVVGKEVKIELKIQAIRKSDI